MLKVGNYGRQIFRFLCRMSGGHNLAGQVPDEYLDPYFLLGQLGLRCCDGCPVPAVTHVNDGITSLLAAGLLVRDDTGVTRIDGWERRQPREVTLNAERQRRHRANKNRELSARNVTVTVPRNVTVTAKRRGEERRRDDVKDSRQLALTPAPPDLETQVFAYWSEKLKHPRAILDDKRRKILRDRVKEGMTLDEGKAVVDGCIRDIQTWPERAKFDGIEYLFKNRGAVEKFADARVPMRKPLASDIPRYEPTKDEEAERTRRALKAAGLDE